MDKPNAGARMSKMVRFAVSIAGVIVIGAVLWWWLDRHQQPAELRLYGNVDLRQIELPFNGNERISAVLVQEGDHVTQGQLLAHLDTSRLAPQVAKAEADLAAQAQSVDRLHHGNRPEEIAQARATLAQSQAGLKELEADINLSRANLNLSKVTLDRWAHLSTKGAVSKQDLDQRQADFDRAFSLHRRAVASISL